MKAWGDRQRIESEIRALFAQAVGASDELQASLARYACVLTSGYIEAGCREVLSAFAQVRAESSVARYVQRRLGLFSDPDVEKLLRLVGDFDPARRVRLEGLLSDKLRDGVNSIHAHRNNIAHGRQSSISLGQVKPYFECATDVIAKMRALFPPSR